MDDDEQSSQEDEWVEVEDPCVKQLIEHYLTRRREDLNTLRSSLVARDFDYIQRQGHKLTGSGTAYGLSKISDIGQSLWDAASSEDTRTISEEINSLERYLSKLRIL